MKLNPKQTLIQPLISEYLQDMSVSESEIEHPWLPHPPNPPTPEAVAKAQFVDKTYQWNGSAAAKAARSQPRN